LRDTLHHLYQEADFEKIKIELSRVANKNSRIIFYDPNINFILKTLRFFSSHKDAVCSFETATEILKSLGYKMVYQEFNTVFSLPLSGGYVGINFVPQIRFLQRFILWSESVCEMIIKIFRLGRYLCLRYMIVGEKIENH
jgi:hypothetical protein